MSDGCLLTNAIEGSLACCNLSSQSDLCEDSRKDCLICQLRGILTVHLCVESFIVAFWIYADDLAVLAINVEPFFHISDIYNSDRNSIFKPDRYVRACATSLTPRTPFIVYTKCGRSR